MAACRQMSKMNLPANTNQYEPKYAWYSLNEMFYVDVSLEQNVYDGRKPVRRLCADGRRREREKKLNIQ